MFSLLENLLHFSLKIVLFLLIITDLVALFILEIFETFHNVEDFILSSSFALHLHPELEQLQTSLLSSQLLLLNLHHLVLLNPQFRSKFRVVLRQEFAQSLQLFLRALILLPSLLVLAFIHSIIQSSFIRPKFSVFLLPFLLSNPSNRSSEHLF